MDTKFVAGTLICVAVIGGAGFWGGMKYSVSKTVGARGQFAAGNFGGRAGGAGPRLSANAAFGTIIAKDANSITVELGTGPNETSTNGSVSGSKIVLYTANTEIGKTVSGFTNDLNIGETVTVNGTPNSDGSLTATVIQIRPANATRPGGGQ